MAKEKVEKEKKRKPKTRGNGEGSIYKRADGRWCAAITVGRTTEGKLKKKVIYGKTRNEVSEKINKELNSLALGNFVDVNNITVESWLNTWLYEYKKTAVRAITFWSYETTIRNHIIPALGYIKLKDLKTEAVQKFYNNKLNKNELSARTIRRMHVIFRNALKQAIKNNLIVTNVTDSVVLPRVVKSEARVFTVEEQNIFLKAIEKERLKALYMLDLGSGMRKAEITALKWKNVDLGKGIIYVKETIENIKVKFDKDATDKYKLIVEEPKSEKGNRIINIPEMIIEELKSHKLRQEKEKETAGEFYIDSDYVFCTKFGKTINHTSLNRCYKRILKKLELQDIKFHAMRHTYATRLLELNVHPRTVQELLGHSDVSITLNTYSKVLPPMKVDAASKINHLFDIKNEEKK